MDQAELGFKVDTAPLEKGAKALYNMAAKAGNTASAVNTLSAATKGLTPALNKLAADTSKQVSADRAMSNSQNKLARDIEKTSNSLRNQASELNNLERASRRAMGGFGGAGGSRGGTGARATGLSATGTGRDQIPNRFNTANIAAQFQDIGVTAAMGMNPLTIALQQGTQLSAVLQSMENPLKGIAAAFKQIINPVALLSIGLTALAAVGLQAVDWAEFGQTALNGLANVIEYLVPLVLGLGASLTVLYRANILAGVGMLVASLKALGPVLLTAASATWAFTTALLANPLFWIGATIAAVTTGLLYLTGVFGKMADAVRGMGREATEVTKKLEEMNTSLFDQQVMLGMTEKAAWKYKTALDVYGVTLDELNEKQKSHLNILEAMKEGLDNEKSRRAMANYNAEMREQINLMNLRKDVQIKDTIASKEALKVHELVADALASGVRREHIDMSAIQSAAAEMVRIEETIANSRKKITKANDNEKDPWADLLKGADRRLATLKSEYAAVGKSAYEVARLRHETDLLNEAQQKGIILSEDKFNELKNLAAGMADVEEKTRKARESFEFLKDTVKSFFNDFRNGLKSGESAWDSFANAAVNALNRIQDKLWEDSLNKIFNNIDFSFGSSGSNPYGNNIDFVPFANGGAFTNGIYSSPTMFEFANGNSFGVMGERGPEAVMPLQRGPDGALGVRVVNNNNRSEPESQKENTYVFNVGEFATQRDVARMQAMVLALAGPGVVESRVNNARSRGGVE